MGVEVELEVLKTVVNKLDTSLGKISEVSNSIGRLLAVHDEKIHKLEKLGDKRDDDIKELHSRITTQTREIVSTIEALEKNIEEKMKVSAAAAKQQHQEIQIEIQKDVSKIDERLGIVERWRWYLIGGATVIGFIFGNIADILKILK